MAFALLALGMALIPYEKRRQFALCVREAWRAQQLSLSAIGGEGRGEVARFRLRTCRGGLSRRNEVKMEAQRRRMRMPSLFWRTASVVSLFALLASEPGFDQLWTAHAQCDIPSNDSHDTMRITNFAYDFEGRLIQVNCPEGVINYSYDLATGRHISTCTTNSYVEYGYDELGRLKIELDTPTIAREMPMNFRRWNSFSATNASQARESLPTQTQHPNSLPASYCCPGQRKGAVLRVCFTSARPVRFRSGMRPFQLCRPNDFIHWTNRQEQM